MRLTIAIGTCIAVLLSFACSRKGTQMTSAEQDKPLHIDRLEGNDLEIPDIEWPPGLPLAERLTYHNKQLLEANGFPQDAASWRRASTAKTEVLREAAYQILARLHEPADDALFRGGLGDASAVVQAWSAWALIQRGDASARRTLEELASREPSFGWHAPIIAASLLGELGQASAWRGFADGWWNASTERYVLVSYALPFYALHGQSYSPGKSIDIWAFDRRALQDPDENTRYAALEQLAERKPVAARAMLEEFVASDKPAYQVALARHILGDLH
jgi:HEAT repeat protein